MSNYYKKAKHNNAKSRFRVLSKGIAHREKTKSCHSFFELVNRMNRFKGYGENILERLMQRYCSTFMSLFKNYLINLIYTPSIFSFPFYILKQTSVCMHFFKHTHTEVYFQHDSISVLRWTCSLGKMLTIRKCQEMTQRSYSK